MRATSRKGIFSSLLIKGATAGLPSSADDKTPGKRCWTSQQWHPDFCSSTLEQAVRSVTRTVAFLLWEYTLD